MSPQKGCYHTTQLTACDMYSFLRSGRFLGMDQNTIIGDTTLNSSATVLAVSVANHPLSVELADRLPAGST